MGPADIVAMRVPVRVDVDGQPEGVQRRPGRMARVGLRDIAAVVYPGPVRVVARRLSAPASAVKASTATGLTGVGLLE